MVDATKMQKQGSVSEEDMSTLLRKYTAQTVLALLQEVAQVPKKKFDWNEMVKNTFTGISNPREYQMLWRHLAYRHDLVDSFDDAADPLDDDSDLEFELEAFPAVSRETSAEAAACVKVLIASGSPSDSHVPSNSTIEAPLTINIPNRETSSAPSESSHLASCMQGTTNITIPVCVQKQQVATVTCAEKKRNNGSKSGNLPPRKKKKPWSEEEDMELIAAVQKCGERNWANILKGEFKGDRTPSELSQRWAAIRRRQGNSNVGTSSQLSETHLAAAHRAMSLALNMPMKDNLKAACQTSGKPSISTRPAFAETSSVGVPPQHQSQQASALAPDQRLGTAGPSKSLVALKRLSNPTDIPRSVVKAMAIAAGARVVNPSISSSPIGTDRSQNTVHAIAGGNSVIKSSTSGLSNQLPSNVHFIRNGLAKAPITSYKATMASSAKPGNTQQAQDHSVTKANAAISATGVARTVEHAAVSSSENVMQENVQRGQADFPGNTPKEDIHDAEVVWLGNRSEEKIAENQASSNASKDNNQAGGASIPFSTPIGSTQDD